MSKQAYTRSDIYQEQFPVRHDPRRAPGETHIMVGREMRQVFLGRIRDLEREVKRLREDNRILSIQLEAAYERETTILPS